MVEISITPGDIKRLGSKLSAFQHQLTREERAILWGALGLASDVLNRDRTARGRTELVTEAPGVGNPRVTIDAGLAEVDDLEPDLPEALAEAFHPEKLAGELEAAPRNAGGNPRGEDDAIKIGTNKIGGIAVHTGRRGE